VIAATAEGPACCGATNATGWPDASFPEVYRTKVGDGHLVVVRINLAVPARVAAQVYQCDSGCLTAVGAPRYAEAGPTEMISELAQRAASSALRIVACAVRAPWYNAQ